MRLFVAIELSEGVREELAAMQTRLRAAGGDVRWSKPENFHLTVMFLGEQEDSLLPDIEAACAAIAGETENFRIQVAGASCFPRRGPLKTLWVGLREGAEAWRALAQRAEGSFAPMGAPRGGDLMPHVTIGRVRSERGVEALRRVLAEESEAPVGAQDAGGLTLVQSFLAPDGAKYQNRGFWPFYRMEEVTLCKELGTGG